MQLKLTTWNINSVRLRIDLVAKFIKAVRPDVLCLQETKCPDDAFPLKRFKRLGYEHIALNGQKGYHGVAVISRLPFDSKTVKGYCGKTDFRHVGAVLGEKAGLRDPLTIHNYYVPAGGDEPDPEINPKFAHKLAFLDEMRDLPAHAARRATSARSWSATSTSRRSNTTSGATSRCSRWCRTRRSNARSSPPRRRPATGSMSRARSCREPEKLYTWWSYRAPDWVAADKGRRLDHIWVSQALGDRLAAIKVTKDARGWERPSDHVPVTVTLEV